jgi:hypothetical protein
MTEAVLGFEISVRPGNPLTGEPELRVPIALDEPFGVEVEYDHLLWMLDGTLRRGADECYHLALRVRAEGDPDEPAAQSQEIELEPNGRPWLIGILRSPKFLSAGIQLRRTPTTA